MITFSKIGKKGNLGNQLFQIASTIGLAVKHNHDFAFLEWKYQDYFKNKLPLFLSSQVPGFVSVEEKQYNYYDWEFKAENYDLEGWLQTEKYFDKELVKHYFEFSDSLKDRITAEYKSVFERRTILISIRRGDFVNHPDYFQTPIKYYLNSLVTFFPDWDSCNLIILSDDINYCKFHFSFLENAFFADGLNEAEQLCLGSLCNDFIISNSTFSWWTAWLGEKSDSKIIRPLRNFDWQKSIELNDKDYYPERWIKYNHLEQKIKVPELAFSIQTKKNKEEIEKYIAYYFDIEFAPNENNFESNKNIYSINKDCFLPPLLIYFSWLKLKNEKTDLVINSLIQNFKVSKALNYKEFEVQNDFGLFSKIFSFSYKSLIKANRSIYLKREANLSFSENFSENEFVLYFSGGQFLNLGGYNFSFKRYSKEIEKNIKKNIKKILGIKK